MLPMAASLGYSGLTLAASGETWDLAGIRLDHSHRRGARRLPIKQRSGKGATRLLRIRVESASANAELADATPTFLKAAGMVHALNTAEWDNSKTTSNWRQRAEGYVLPAIGNVPLNRSSPPRNPAPHSVGRSPGTTCGTGRRRSWPAAPDRHRRRQRRYPQGAFSQA